MSETAVATALTPLFVGDDGWCRGDGRVRAADGDGDVPDDRHRGLDPRVGASALRRWRPRCRATTSILDEAITSHGGVRPVEQGEGDSVVAAFSRASDAVGAALAAQRDAGRRGVARGRSSSRSGWRCTRVRHSCVTRATTSGWQSSAAPGCRSCGHGGQVLLSDVTAALVADELPGGVGVGRPRTAPVEGSRAPGADLAADAPGSGGRVPAAGVVGRVPAEPAAAAVAVDRPAGARSPSWSRRARRRSGRDADRVGRCREDSFGVGGGCRAGRLVPGWRVVRRAGRRRAATGSVGRATLKALGLPETPGVAPAEVAAVELGEARPVVGHPRQLRAPDRRVRRVRRHGARREPDRVGAGDQP